MQKDKYQVYKIDRYKEVQLCKVTPKVITTQVTPQVTPQVSEVLEETNSPSQMWS